LTEQLLASYNYASWSQLISAYSYVLPVNNYSLGG